MITFLTVKFLPSDLSRAIKNDFAKCIKILETHSDFQQIFFHFWATRSGRCKKKCDLNGDRDDSNDLLDDREVNDKINGSCCRFC